MTIPLELLKQFGLSQDQIAAIQAASLAEARAGGPENSLRNYDGAPRTEHDQLVRHLDHILNAPTGLSRWSTDPINKCGFLLPTGPGAKKKAGRLLPSSKSMECLASPSPPPAGPRGPFDLQAVPPPGFKRSRSSEQLGRVPSPPTADARLARMQGASKSMHSPLGAEALSAKAFRRQIEEEDSDGEEGRDVYLPQDMQRRKEVRPNGPPKRELYVLPAARQVKEPSPIGSPLKAPPSPQPPQRKASVTATEKGASFAPFPTTGPFRLDEPTVAPVNQPPVLPPSRTQALTQPQRMLAPQSSAQPDSPVSFIGSPETRSIECKVASPQGASKRGAAGSPHSPVPAPRTAATPLQQYGQSPMAAQQQQYYAFAQQQHQIQSQAQAQPEIEYPQHTMQHETSLSHRRPQQEQAAPVPMDPVPEQKAANTPARTYSLLDLMQELELPSSATSSLRVEPPSATHAGDKYGSLYELKTATEEDSDWQPSSTVDGSDGVSVIQTEPILPHGYHQTPPLSAHTDLSQEAYGHDDGEPNLLQDTEDPARAYPHGQHRQQQQPRASYRPDFSGVLQSRFASKYGGTQESLSGSQLTMVGSTSSMALGDLQASQLDLDALLCDAQDLGQQQPRDAGLSSYPLMSPGYSQLLKQNSAATGPPTNRSPTAAAKNERPELAGLDDPQVSALLAGVREEITARDAALYLAYRNAARHRHTSMPLSFQELKQRIEEYGLDIQFREERKTSDVKQLFLLPLNGITVPRWVPPATSFRIGRGSNWFLAQTRVVSRNHCEIFHDIHTYYVKDVGSRSGTYVNGTRIGEAEAISMPRELKHGDILQVGVDFASERDPYGQIADTYKCGQCIALYGYKTRAAVSLCDELSDLKPTGRALDSAARGSSSKKSSLGVSAMVTTVSESKFERMARKALAMKSRLAAADTRLFIEFGDYISDTSAGTAVLHRPDGQPSYSFMFNNYKFSWDIGMTCRASGAHYGMNLASPDGRDRTCAVYKIYSGFGMEKCVATVTVQGEHKCLLEPVYEQSILDEEEAIAERDLVNRLVRHQRTSSQLSGCSLSIPSPSPYLVAGRPQGQPSPLFAHVPAIATPFPLLYSSTTSTPTADAGPAPRNPFYTLTGDLPAPSLAFYVQRFANSRKQVFLGEGQVSARKSAWGKKTIFYEARLPPAEQHDELLAMVTLFNVLNQLEKM